MIYFVEQHSLLSLLPEGKDLFQDDEKRLMVRIEKLGPKNTFDSTVEVLEKIHSIVCPVCNRQCKDCTRVIGYEDALEGVSKTPWEVELPAITYRAGGKAVGE